MEPLIGKSGILSLNKLSVEALEGEDYLIFAASTKDGEKLDREQCQRLFSLPAKVEDTGGDGVDIKPLGLIYQREKNKIIEDIGQRNAVYFDEEMDKLNRWADDKRKSLKATLKDYDDQIAELKKQMRQAPNLPEKLALQKKIRVLDKKRDEAWRQYDEAAREVERQKDTLLDQVEARLKQETKEKTFFTIQWELI